MKVLTKTDIGKARSMNQDSFLVSENKDNGLNLYILADGMGGYKGGEIASKVAIQAVSKFITEKFDDISKDKQSILDLLEDAIAFKNVSNMPARVKCALLAWHTMEDLLNKNGK